MFIHGVTVREVDKFRQAIRERYNGKSGWFILRTEQEALGKKIWGRFSRKFPDVCLLSDLLKMAGFENRREGEKIFIQRLTPTEK